ncbi:MAG: 5-bromo-4-chloroindolyl phosphate hydrolysis family protein [Mailhella sp.]|nr:5-bromo-4-chloroindolyl phosphate hydrolysis family protein [Mailhella sp.]
MPSPSEIIKQGLEDTASFAGLVLRRLGVHFLSLLAAIELFEDSFSEQFCAYIGLICLFPRGKLTDIQWYAPTGIGLLQALILLPFYPPGLSLLIGGCQTWAQRLLGARGKIGWEWAVTPMFLVCYHAYSSNPEAASVDILFLLTFPVLLAAGWLLLRKRRRAAQSDNRVQILQQARQTLKNAVSRNSLQTDLQHQAEMLLKQAETYSRWGAGDPDDPFPLAQRILATAQAVDKIGRKAALNAEAEKNSDINRWINSARRQDKQNKTGAASQEDITLKDVQNLTALLLEKNSSGSAAETPEANEYADYEKSARELLQKKKALPEDLADFVEKIAFSTFSIIQSMRDDPADRTPGGRFLAKYLPITHRIVDEHQRLSSINVKSDDVASSLSRSHELMERLAKAFADEYVTLQQNDAINFTAELNALDAVLKMQGH